MVPEICYILLWHWKDLHVLCSSYTHIYISSEALYIMLSGNLIRYRFYCNYFIRDYDIESFLWQQSTTLTLAIPKSAFIIEPRQDKTCLREFPTLPDTNRPA